jgi:hypothetical protein
MACRIPAQWIRTIAVDETINIVQALKTEVAALRRVLMLNMKVADTYPGDSQVDRINSLIDELEGLIKQSGSTEREASK